MQITKHIARLALIFVALIIAYLFDEEILVHVIGLRVPAINNLFVWISYAGSFIVVLFVMTSLFIWETRERKKIPLLWLTLGTASLVTWLLKMVVTRPRPLVEALVPFDTFSFPSGHATAVFSALPLLLKEFPKYAWFWITFAVLVVFSRLYLGVHYLSDVIAGAFIGYVIGVVLLWIEEKTKVLERLFFRLKNALR